MKFDDAMFCWNIFLNLIKFKCFEKTKEEFEELSNTVNKDRDDQDEGNDDDSMDIQQVTKMANTSHSRIVEKNHNSTNIQKEKLSPTSRLKQQLKKKSRVFESKVLKEMSIYEALPDAFKNSDILQWWKKHNTALPLLATLARVILAIPASSAKSEKVFSVLCWRKLCDQKQNFT